VETRYSPIRDKGEARLLPNLQSYTEECAAFEWNEAESILSKLPGGGWNIAHEAVDRHAFGSRGDHVAIRWLGRKGEIRDFSYSALAEATSRFASGLRQLGVERGDRVFTLSSRIPELYIATLGTLKNGSVAAPLFSAFGPEPIETRFKMGEGRVLMTTEPLYRRKIEPIRDRLVSLQHVILVGGAADGTISFEDLLKTGDPDMPAEEMTPEDMALLHFTSGTTGMPKGAVHVHRAVLHHHLSARYALDLHPVDIYWCTADPG